MKTKTLHDGPGRPATGRNTTPFCIALTDERRKVAEQIGGKVGAGVYKILDWLTQNPTIAAKIRSFKQ